MPRKKQFFDPPLSYHKTFIEVKNFNKECHKTSDTPLERDVIFKRFLSKTKRFQRECLQLSIQKSSIKAHLRRKLF